jgi:hypothetical protein
MGPLFLSAECGPATAADIAWRLNGFANKIDVAGSSSGPLDHNDLPVRGHENLEGDGSPLRELIDTRLRDLEITVTQPPSQQDQAGSHVPA